MKPRSSASLFLARHWFLIALVLILPIGVFGSNLLRILTDQGWLRTAIVVIVMWMMALPIPIELVKNSIRKPWPSTLASLINMGLIPLAVWGLIPFLSTYYGGGLMVAAAIPCTLASAAVWTRRAGGDDTVAVLVTLITNVACVIVTPLWLMIAIGRTVQLDVRGLILELLLVILLPMAAAQVMRKHNRVAKWAEKRKSQLSIACQVGILSMVFLGAIQMGQRITTAGTAQSVSTGSTIEMLIAIGLTSTLHVLGLIVGWWSAGATGVARPQQIGVAISGSQKTLMVGLQLAMNCGVSIVPMVAYHVGQLLIDTIVAEYWRGEASG
ncbi:MAG: bile acid:sodium symporter [Pirellulales bacterium]